MSVTSKNLNYCDSHISNDLHKDIWPQRRDIRNSTTQTPRLILLLTGAVPSANETALAKNCVPSRPATNCPRYRLNRSAERLQRTRYMEVVIEVLLLQQQLQALRVSSEHTHTWSAGFGRDVVGLPTARSRELATWPNPHGTNEGESDFQKKSESVVAAHSAIQQANRAAAARLTDDDRSQRAIAMMYGEGLGIVLKLSNFQWNAGPVWDRERENERPGGGAEWMKLLSNK